MPLDPKRVQAVFLSAVECHEPAARAAVRDRECWTYAALRLRVAGSQVESRTARQLSRRGGHGRFPETGR